MIVLAGGTGRLGKIVARSLTEKGYEVRIFSRHGELAHDWKNPLVTGISGDVRNPRDVERALTGAEVVISAIQGFSGTGGTNPRSVDYLGNLNLIRSAQSLGIKRFILLSIVGASPNHPIDLFRMKYLAEQQLKKIESGSLSWTIIRCTAFMESWMELIIDPLLKTGKTRIFGSGANPINFISVYDVARYISHEVKDNAMTDDTVEIGGPENSTFMQFVETFESITGKNAVKISKVSLLTMKFMARIMLLAKPALARQIRTAIWMDTSDLRFDPKETVDRYPGVSVTRLSDAIGRDYLKQYRG